MTELTFRRFNTADARAHRTQVENIYRRAYVVSIAEGRPFAAPDAFMQRFDAYTRGDRGLELVTAAVDGVEVGQAWGWPLAPDTAWWGGVQLDDPAADVAAFVWENGYRTFALSEIMVDAAHTGHGIARALHDQLLAGRRESRATLLVNPANTRAYAAYTRWGWERVGTLTPGWPDAPTFDVLIRPAAGDTAKIRRRAPR